jgi:hypothetical protein
MTPTTKEIVWLRWLLVNIRVSLSHLTPIYCDGHNSFLGYSLNSYFFSKIKIKNKNNKIKIK